MYFICKRYWKMGDLSCATPHFSWFYTFRLTTRYCVRVEKTTKKLQHMVDTLSAKCYTVQVGNEQYAVKKKEGRE